MTALELTKAWNRNHNPGTQVRMLRKGRLGLDVTTKSAAFVSEGEAVIRIDGFGIVKLEALQVQEVQTKKRGIA